MRNLKKVLSLALALVMLVGMMVVGAGAVDATEYPDYGDVSANKQEAMQVITALSVMDGTDKGLEPTATLTRAMAATIITRALLGRTVADALSSSTCVFTDVTADWAKGAIQYCADMGIVNGVGNNMFAPNSPVKGTEFAAMLLRAVDPDGDYVGESWASKVIVAANKNGLSKNIPVTATELSREGAAQMAFNTITEYSPSGATGYVVDGLGGQFDTWFEAFVAAGGLSSNSSTAAAAPGKVHSAKNDTLAKTVFGLTETSDTDAFGRDFKAWALEGEDDPIVVTDIRVTAPTVTYTKGGVNASDVTKATDASNSSVPANKIYTNSTTAGSGADVNVETLCQNGRIVEIYASNKTIDKVIVIDEYVGTVNRVNAAKGDTKRSVTVNGRSFTTEDFEKDDVVLYNVVDNKIVAMKLAEAVEGTSVTSFRDNSVNTNSGNFSYHTGFAAPTWSFTGTYTLYLDSYGYVIMQKAETASESAPQYALAVRIADSGFNKVALLVLPDGSTEQVTLASDSTFKSNIDEGDDPHLVSFTVNNDGQYKLADSAKAAEQTYNASTAAIVRSGEAVVRLNKNDTTNANNNTLFFVKTDTNKYTVYQGLTNVPTLTAGATTYKAKVASIIKNRVAAAVYVDGTSNVTSSAASEASYIFVLGDTTSRKINDANLGEYYVYTAIVDGEVNTEFKVKSQITSEKVFSSVSYDKNDVATMGTEVGTAAKTGYEKPNGGVMVIGSTAYTYADNTLLFYIEDGALSDGYFNEITRDDSNDHVWVIANDKNEASVIVIKAEDDTATSGNTTTVSGNTEQATIGAVTKDSSGNVTAGKVVVNKGTTLTVTSKIEKGADVTIRDFGGIALSGGATAEEAVKLDVTNTSEDIKNLPAGVPVLLPNGFTTSAGVNDDIDNDTIVFAYDGRVAGKAVKLTIKNGNAVVYTETLSSPATAGKGVFYISLSAPTVVNNGTAGKFITGTYYTVEITQADNTTPLFKGGFTSTVTTPD